ncbi:molybdopterin-dependent oxidoreductase [bacterium]|nr:molybdopterin-dependent oxidoreductase [bacterium]
MDTQVTSTICRICLRSCGIRVHQTATGTRITGNPDHPVSRGFICFRGAHYDEIWGSPDRIREPLLKKKGSWQSISFDDAIALLAEKIRSGKQKHGAQSIAFLKGESLKHQEISGYIRHLTHALGSPNYLTIGSMCQRALAMGHELTYGGAPKIDFQRIKVAILWGRNLAVASFQMFNQMEKAIKKGLKLIVIDPAATKTAKAAHLHLRITPGSDGLLALAFIKSAIESYNISADPDHEIGWAELKNYLQNISYASLLEKTGISQSEFFNAAALIFENRPCFNQAGLGLELQPNGIQTIRAIACLQSLVDPNKFPTGMAFPMAPLPDQDNYPEMPEPIGIREAPLFVRQGGEGQAMYLPKAVLQDDPYPVRTLVVVGSNPALTFPAASIQKKMFERLDFMAVSDLFMTTTAQQADLVLPAADFLDNLEIHDYGRFGKSYLGLVRPVKRSGTGWPAWKLIFELAHQLDLHSFFPWQNNEEALKYKLSNTGISYECLKNSPTGLVSYPAESLNNEEPDNSKKVHYFSQAVEDVADMGSLTADSFELPFTTDAAYPFWLSTGDRVAVYQHSQFRVAKVYLEKEPKPKVNIHPDAADSLGIKDGDIVTLATRDGEVSVEACLSDNVRIDCLQMTHGWEQANVNEVTGLKYFDPISGFPWCRALPAKITKIVR